MKTQNWTKLVSAGERRLAIGFVLVIAGGLQVAAGQAPPEPLTPSQIHERNLMDLRGRAEILEADDVEGLPSSKLNGILQNKGLFDTTVTRTPPMPPSTVSVESLKKIPKKAKKAYERATRFRENVEFGKAEQEYLKAITYFPEYTEAHGDLGVLYVYLRRYLESETQLRRAIELSPRNSIGYSNLGWTLAALGKLADAEQSARKALEFNPGNPHAHLLLGGLMIGLDGSEERRKEGFKHLEVAAKSLPVAQQRLKELGR
jgi:tetratricopeptide (TPR) repeat protein